MMRWQQWAVAVIVAAIFMASIKAPVMAQDKPAAPGFYGLYAWVTDVNKYADDLNKAGIRWLRVGGWAGQNSADDTACLVAARNGFHLVPTLFMREISHSRSMPIDELIPAWRKVVRESVQRYGPAGTLWKENPSVPPQPVRYWQIWNEPNIEFLNPPQGVTRVQLYAELLKAASEEIRKLDPGATIIAFNTAGGAALGKPSPDVYVEQHKFFGWRRFIKESNEITGVACFDAIGLHPYTMPDGPEAGGVAKGLQLQIGRAHV